MAKHNCPGCASETSFCLEHQKARAEYAEMDRGNRDRDTDPVYIALLKKYGETDEDL